MDTQPAFGFKELFTHIVGEMAKAVAERNGEAKQQQMTRSQGAVHMIMGFLPRDVIEAMLAGHCVMFHEVMTDSVRDTLRGEMDTMRRGTRGNLVALNKAFESNLNRLERYQLRPSDGRRDVAEPDARGETAGAPLPAAPPVTARPRSVPVRQPVAATLDVKAQAKRAVDAPVAEYHPSPEAIAACRANPEAMAALSAGDPEAFARAMGVDLPDEAYVAAASQTGTFNRQGLPEAHRPGGGAENRIGLLARETAD